MPPKKPYTFAIRISQRFDPKLQKSMSCQTLTKIKYDRTTKCINHWSISG